MENVIDPDNMFKLLTTQTIFFPQLQSRPVIQQMFPICRIHSLPANNHFKFNVDNPMNPINLFRIWSIQTSHYFLQLQSTDFERFDHSHYQPFLFLLLANSKEVKTIVVNSLFELILNAAWIYKNLPFFKDLMTNLVYWSSLSDKLKTLNLQKSMWKKFQEKLFGEHPFTQKSQPYIFHYNLNVFKHQRIILDVVPKFTDFLLQVE